MDSLTISQLDELKQQVDRLTQEEHEASFRSQSLKQEKRELDQKLQAIELQGRMNIPKSLAVRLRENKITLTSQRDQVLTQWVRAQRERHRVSEALMTAREAYRALTVHVHDLMTTLRTIREDGKHHPHMLGQVEAEARIEELRRELAAIIGPAEAAAV